MCDLPRVSDHSDVKAKRTYDCSLCGWEIAKGERHRVYSGLFDDGWEHHRMHSDCAEAHVALANAEWGDGCAPLDGRDLDPDEDVLRSPDGVWTAVLR